VFASENLKLVEDILAFNAGRDPERLQIKYRKMRSGAFAFMRGTNHLFCEQVAAEGSMSAAPLVWACGDLQIENFGSYRGENGLVHFDINDFDDAALAPASWDLLRLLTSVRIASLELDLKKREIRSFGSALLEAHVEALRSGKAYWVERENSSGLVRELLDGLRKRKRARFLKARTRIKGAKILLNVDGVKALPATATQRSVVSGFMKAFAQTQPEPEFFKVLDIARRISGTGSLGVDRFVILIAGKGAPDGLYLLDLKQSMPSQLALHLPELQPHWESEAHRVVELQKRMQAVSMAFLHPVQYGSTVGVLRNLQPAEDRITLARSGQSVAALEAAIRTMGQILAWAQLRSARHMGSEPVEALIDFSRETRWQKALLSLSEDSAEQVRKAAAVFNAAYDDHVFS
jgi:uncharacterized protein (DUF2252 family)